MKPKIKTEINILVKIGVLEKVEYSEWATPVVGVLKPDGAVPFSGYHKVTVNPVLETSRHPLPESEEFFN